MSEKDMRDRLLLPVLIPVGALAFIGFLAVGMAEILLNVPHSVATAIALMLAFNMMVAFAVAALKPNLSKFLMVGMGGVVLVPLLFGAAAAGGAVSFPDAQGHGEEAGGPVLELAANSLAFDKSALEAPADTAFEISFDNQEAQPHNVAILSAEGSSEVLFRGALITGPEQTTYRVDAIAAGSYPFLCDVHPNMAGTITVA